MGIEEYEKWREGYIDGINSLGNFLQVLKNVEDKKLRETIEMLQEQWSNYGKTKENAEKEVVLQ